MLYPSKDSYPILGAELKSLVEFKKRRRYSAEAKILSNSAAPTGRGLNVAVH